ncbi:hypothetical protein O0L34_g9973 [Tuta absoluta]|nr:hypothetical protein O0L34_g9973 [Tuta absoluta]
MEDILEIDFTAEEMADLDLSSIEPDVIRAIEEAVRMLGGTPDEAGTDPGDLVAWTPPPSPQPQGTRASGAAGGRSGIRMDAATQAQPTTRNQGTQAATGSHTVGTQTPWHGRGAADHTTDRHRYTNANRRRSEERRRDHSPWRHDHRHVAEGAYRTPRGLAGERRRRMKRERIPKHLRGTNSR